jgi:hypothetical protein
MNILFLRGFWPTDRENPKEILYDSIKSETDVWTELAYAMTGPDDRCTVLYGGYKHVSKYSKNFEVRFVPLLSGYSPEHKPDLIIARGGFSEYHKFLKRFHWATKVYYGAGKKSIPSFKFHDYDFVLADSDEQREQVLRVFPNMRVINWIKPASHIFKPIEHQKKYDACFVAVHPRDRRKRVNWVWDTVPKDIRILQLGNPHKKRSPPNNVTIKNVSRESMPKAMCKCWIGIAPYGSDDSCPRVVPEFFACDMPVVGRTSLRIWTQKYPVVLASKEEFWDRVRKEIARAKRREKGSIREMYERELSIEVAAQYLMERVRGLEHE